MADRPLTASASLGGDRFGIRGDNADRPPPTARPELDSAGNEREKRVVAAAADHDPRVEMRTSLAHQDLAGVDELAAESLHAEALRVGVTPVPAGRGALLVCHLSVTSQAVFFSLALLFAVRVLAPPLL